MRYFKNVGKDSLRVGFRGERAGHLLTKRAPTQDLTFRETMPMSSRLRPNAAMHCVFSNRLRRPSLDTNCTRNCATTVHYEFCRMYETEFGNG